MPNRRSFLKASAAAAAASALPRLSFAESTAPERPVGRAAKPLNILILGGTGFTGPEQVEYAIARGHKVTLINRNKTRPDFFKGKVEQLIGDLGGDMSALKGLKFDVVIDNPTTYPYWVRNVAQYMKGNTDHYIFISTVSVYASEKNAWADESDPTQEMPKDLDPYTLEPAARGRNYGQLKAFSEKLVQQTYPNSTIIRPGLIVGPLDTSNRFTWWPYRIDKGGEVLVPGDGSDPVQFIDARDLAEFTVRMAENRTTGVFNATGPEHPMRFDEMVYGIRAVTTSGAQFTWVPWDFLTEQKLRGWSNFPVVVQDRADNGAWNRRSIKKALAAGLTFRPLAVTAKDTLDWNKTRSAADLQGLLEPRQFGTAPAKEAEVLKLWHDRKKS